jgi:hypothetical protein
MANWAQVGYRIEGKQKDLQEIYELFGEFDKGEMLLDQMSESLANMSL